MKFNRSILFDHLSCRRLEERSVILRRKPLRKIVPIWSFILSAAGQASRDKPHVTRKGFSRDEHIYISFPGVSSLLNTRHSEEEKQWNLDEILHFGYSYCRRLDERTKICLVPLAIIYFISKAFFTNETHYLSFCRISFRSLDTGGT